MKKILAACILSLIFLFTPSTVEAQSFCNGSPFADPNQTCPVNCPRHEFYSDELETIMYQCGDFNTTCGQTRAVGMAGSCNCPAANNTESLMLMTSGGRSITRYCCGWPNNGTCLATNPNSGSQQTEDDDKQGSFNDFNAGSQVTNQTFDQLNPLRQFGDEPGLADELSTPGGILTRLLTYAFPLAGLILFVMIVWSGFEMVAGAENKKSQESGKQRLTAAVIGFVLLFVSYWIIQLVEVITGAQIF